MVKPKFYRSLATNLSPPHSTPLDLQLQFELVSSLQNSIIYNKMDFIESALINP